MTARTAVRRKALSVAEVLALPAMPDAWPDGAGACGGIGRTAWYELIARGETPVPVIRVGRALKVRKADLLNFLGLSDPIASEENGTAPRYQPGASAGNDEEAGYQPASPVEQPIPTAK
ncbi:hypothetical protein [Streptomyces turgidiscabies]|uniref:hypothetical protein n=1 Tax=Streptomyces turgidiscabies TaxID=85558 RepID=UPI0038F75230